MDEYQIQAQVDSLRGILENCLVGISAPDALRILDGLETELVGMKDALGDEIGD